MRRADQVRLASHMAQERLARAAQGLCLAAGGFGTLWHGLPSLLLGIAAYWVFGLARPGPTADLDKLTGRDDR